MALPNLIHCGRVLKPHGLKGEVCTLWFADSPLLLSGLTRLYLRQGRKAPRAFNILSWRKHRNRYLVVLDKISGRDQAEEWHGADIFVSARKFPRSDQDETYIFELLESSVFLPGDIFLGVLKDIADNQGSEVWKIITHDHQEVLFPANQQFIISVDTDRKIIVIDPPEGLIEIYGVDINTLICRR